MSNGWYQLEHNRPRKGVPYLPGGTPRREPYIPVTRSTASEPPIPERLPQEPPAPPVRQRETEPAPLVEAAPAEEQGETAWERTDSAPPPMPEEEPSAHSQTVGAGGPVVLLDGALHETLAGFIHEKPLERAVHAKGWGAFGQFETGRAMGEYTMLPFLQGWGSRRPRSPAFPWPLAAGTRLTHLGTYGASPPNFTPATAYLISSAITSPYSPCGTPCAFRNSSGRWGPRRGATSGTRSDSGRLWPMCRRRSTSSHGFTRTRGP